MPRKTATLAAALAAVLTTAIVTAHAAEQITPPAVPQEIVVDAGFKPFFVGHAVGTQNYMCAVTTTGGLDWLAIGPQATIFNDEAEQTLTHFQSWNPSKNAIQSTWQHSRDTSAVWATRYKGSSDPLYVAPGAIEWLLLEVMGAQTGPGGGDKLVQARFIHRVNTIGGMKPAAAECTLGMLTQRRLVYYEADYYFYR